MISLSARIESVLFFKGEPISVTSLARLLGEDVQAIEHAISELESFFVGRGFSLIRKDEMIELGTSPEAGKIIEQLAKEETSGELSRAALETLTIILYKEPIVKSEVDSIRGVDSGFILRNLMVRGLVERVHDDENKRVYLYKATIDTLRYLGINKVDDLPGRDNEAARIDENLRKLDDNREEAT